jgi:TonB family protein
MSRIKVIIVLLAFGTWAGLAQDTSDAHLQSQPTQMPRLIRVSGAVMVGLVKRRALPEYPEEAQRTEIQGDVIFKIVIDEAGKIVLCEPVESDPLLVAASIDALRDFRFRPYQLNGKPTRVESQLAFRFGLNRTGEVSKGHVEYISTIPYQPEFRTGVLITKGAFVLWPRKVSGDEPQLPPDLVGKSGSVYLTVTVGTGGRVQDVRVVGGNEAFIDLVVDAVKQFVYEPQLVEGKPSVATIQISYHFGRQR